jgi:hypothetical protein
MPELVMLQVTDGALKKNDISKFVDMFKPLTPSPDLQSYRGRCMIVFPMYDNDPREVWQIPEARRYVQRLDAEIPYLPYFLVHDNRAWQVMFWLACLLQFKASQGGIEYNPEKAVALVVSRLATIRAFCRRIGDDYAMVSTSILKGLPEELATMARAEMGAAQGAS